MDAFREFSVAEDRLRRLGKWRPDLDLLVFANAALKFAGREYLKAKNGQRGAIEDFKELVLRGFEPEECADHIALCYLDVGHEHYTHDRFEDAQRAQMSNEAGMTKGATAGSIAIATGCVAASALGQAYIAVPCVIGGALYTGAVKLAH